jgi:cell fate (sporulation/competence/biofilm development) regulator YlbF (YheA/YmcA/DUF963 family)
MESNEMIQKMTTSCKVLNDILRDSQKYDGLKKKYDDLENDGKMHKMNDLYDLCEEFEKLQVV